VILGAAWNGLSFARSLGRRGVPVLLLESTRFLGTYTRFGKVLMLPPVESAPAAWMEVLGLVGSRLDRPGVLVPTGDAHALLVTRNEPALRRSFQFVVPPREVVERIVDKRLQYAAAREAGVPVPNTHYPASVEDLRGLVADLRFPCLVKPYASHMAQLKLGRKVSVVHSASDGVAAYRNMEEHGIPAMIQEIVPGGDRALVGYLAFWDEGGREVAWLTKRKLRQNPPGFGDGSLQVSAELPEVAELSRRLLLALDYRGFVGVEFKLDAGTGTHYLIEVNPRTVSGNQLAISAGVDFPWIAYRHLTESVAEAGRGIAFRPGVKYVNEELDLLAYLALRRSKAITTREWLRSIRGAEAKALGAWDDPMPLIVGLKRFIDRLVSAALGIVVRSRRRPHPSPIG
jgi:D-aspartate ligase